MPPEPVLLVVTHLEVYDDLAEQTYTVALEDFVLQLDNSQPPGVHRDTIIQLLNAGTEDRQPQWVTEDGRRFAHVTDEEYSGIKLNVFVGLMKWMKAGSRGGDVRGGNTVM
jgi:hypothetical protein